MMTNLRVDYDRLAAGYDRRFRESRLTGEGQALLALASNLPARRVLEVGCGTGHWLANLAAVTPALYGLDPSPGMLAQARRRPVPLKLNRGVARQLPFKAGCCELVYCVNAIHHFQDPPAFIHAAARVLGRGGVLAVIGIDPRDRRNQWYGYHYFEGTYETDLQRFPAWPVVLAWMQAAGFSQIELRQVERVEELRQGRAVLADPFLSKSSTSQLALLSDEAYATGLQRIEAALQEAEARGETIVFPSEFSIEMMTGSKINV